MVRGERKVWEGEAEKGREKGYFRGWWGEDNVCEGERKVGKGRGNARKRQIKEESGSLAKSSRVREGGKEGDR